MTVLRNPVVLFLVAGACVLAGIVVASDLFVRAAAEREAVNDARATTILLARSVAQPALPTGLVDGDAGAVDRLDRQVLDRLLVGEVLRIKIWNRDGVVVYSDATDLIGNQYDLDDEEIEVVEDGGVVAEVSDLAKEENRYERDLGGVVEVYTRIWSPEGEPLLFEVYYADADLRQREAEVFAPFRRITHGRPARAGAARQRDDLRAHHPPHPGLAASGSGCWCGRPTPRRRNAGGSPATCTTGWCRTWPAPPSPCTPPPATRPRRPACGRRSARRGSRCGSRCGRCGRCSSRSTHQTSARTGWRRPSRTSRPRPARPG